MEKGPYILCQVLARLVGQSVQNQRFSNAFSVGKKKLYYIRDWPLSCQKLIDGLVTWRSPLYFGKKKKRVESSFATISNMAHHTALAPPLKV